MDLTATQPVTKKDFLTKIKKAQYNNKKCCLTCCHSCCKKCINNISSSGKDKNLKDYSNGEYCKVCNKILLECHCPCPCICSCLGDCLEKKSTVSSYNTEYPINRKVNLINELYNSNSCNHNLDINKLEQDSIRGLSLIEIGKKTSTYNQKNGKLYPDINCGINYTNIMKISSSKSNHRNFLNNFEALYTKILNFILSIIFYSKVNVHQEIKKTDLLFAETIPNLEKPIGQQKRTIICALCGNKLLRSNNMLLDTFQQYSATSAFIYICPKRCCNFALCWLCSEQFYTQTIQQYTPQAIKMELVNRTSLRLPFKTLETLYTARHHYINKQHENPTYIYYDIFNKDLFHPLFNGELATYVRNSLSSGAVTIDKPSNKKISNVFQHRLEETILHTIVNKRYPLCTKFSKNGPLHKHLLLGLKKIKKLDAFPPILHSGYSNSNEAYMKEYGNSNQTRFALEADLRLWRLELQKIIPKNRLVTIRRVILSNAHVADATKMVLQKCDFLESNSPIMEVAVVVYCKHYAGSLTSCTIAILSAVPRNNYTSCGDPYSLIKSSYYGGPVLLDRIFKLRERIENSKKDNLNSTFIADNPGILSLKLAKTEILSGGEGIDWLWNNQNVKVYKSSGKTCSMHGNSSILNWAGELEDRDDNIQNSPRIRLDKPSMYSSRSLDSPIKHRTCVLSSSTDFFQPPIDVIPLKKNSTSKTTPDLPKRISNKVKQKYNKDAELQTTKAWKMSLVERLLKGSSEIYKHDFSSGYDMLQFLQGTHRARAIQQKLLLSEFWHKPLCSKIIFLNESQISMAPSYQSIAISRSLVGYLKPDLNFKFDISFSLIPTLDHSDIARITPVSRALTELPQAPVPSKYKTINEDKKWARVEGRPGKQVIRSWQASRLFHKIGPGVFGKNTFKLPKHRLNISKLSELSLINDQDIPITSLHPISGTDKETEESMRVFRTNLSKVLSTDTATSSSDSQAEDRKRPYHYEICSKNTNTLAWLTNNKVDKELQPVIPKIVLPKEKSKLSFSYQPDPIDVAALGFAKYQPYKDILFLKYLRYKYESCKENETHKSFTNSYMNSESEPYLKHDFADENNFNLNLHYQVHNTNESEHQSKFKNIHSNDEYLMAKAIFHNITKHLFNIPLSEHQQNSSTEIKSILQKTNTYDMDLSRRVFLSPINSKQEVKNILNIKSVIKKHKNLLNDVIDFYIPRDSLDKDVYKDLRSSGEFKDQSDWNILSYSDIPSENNEEKLMKPNTDLNTRNNKNIYFASTDIPLYNESSDKHTNFKSIHIERALRNNQLAETIHSVLQRLPIGCSKLSVGAQLCLMSYSDIKVLNKFLLSTLFLDNEYIIYKLNGEVVSLGYRNKFKSLTEVRKAAVLLRNQPLAVFVCSYLMTALTELKPTAANVLDLKSVLNCRSSSEIACLFSVNELNWSSPNEKHNSDKIFASETKRNIDIQNKLLKNDYLINSQVFQSRANYDRKLSYINKSNLLNNFTYTKRSLTNYKKFKNSVQAKSKIYRSNSCEGYPIPRQKMSYTTRNTNSISNKDSNQTFDSENINQYRNITKSTLSNMNLVKVHSNYNKQIDTKNKFQKNYSKHICYNESMKLKNKKNSWREISTKLLPRVLDSTEQFNSDDNYGIYFAENIDNNSELHFGFWEPSWNGIDQKNINNTLVSLVKKLNSLELNTNIPPYKKNFVKLPIPVPEKNINDLNNKKKQNTIIQDNYLMFASNTVNSLLSRVTGNTLDLNNNIEEFLNSSGPAESGNSLTEALFYYDSVENQLENISKKKVNIAPKIQDTSPNRKVPIFLNSADYTAFSELLEFERNKDYLESLGKPYQKNTILPISTRYILSSSVPYKILKVLSKRHLSSSISTMPEQFQNFIAGLGFAYNQLCKESYDPKDQQHGIDWLPLYFQRTYYFTSISSTQRPLLPHEYKIRTVLKGLQNNSTKEIEKVFNILYKDLKPIKGKLNQWGLDNIDFFKLKSKSQNSETNWGWSNLWTSEQKKSFVIDDYHQHLLFTRDPVNIKNKSTGLKNLEKNFEILTKSQQPLLKSIILGNHLPLQRFKVQNSSSVEPISYQLNSANLKQSLPIWLMETSAKINLNNITLHEHDKTNSSRLLLQEAISWRGINKIGDIAMKLLKKETIFTNDVKNIHSALNEFKQYIHQKGFKEEISTNEQILNYIQRNNNSISKGEAIFKYLKCQEVTDLVETPKSNLTSLDITSNVKLHTQTKSLLTSLDYLVNQYDQLGQKQIELILNWIKQNSITNELKFAENNGNLKNNSISCLKSKRGFSLSNNNKLCNTQSVLLSNKESNINKKLKSTKKLATSLITKPIKQTITKDEEINNTIFLAERSPRHHLPIKNTSINSKFKNDITSFYNLPSWKLPNQKTKNTFIRPFILSEYDPLDINHFKYPVLPAYSTYYEIAETYKHWFGSSIRKEELDIYLQIRPGIDKSIFGMKYIENHMKDGNMINTDINFKKNPTLDKNTCYLNSNKVQFAEKTQDIIPTKTLKTGIKSITYKSNYKENSNNRSTKNFKLPSRNFARRNKYENREINYNLNMLSKNNNFKLKNNKNLKCTDKHAFNNYQKSNMFSKHNNHIIKEQNKHSFKYYNNIYENNRISSSKSPILYKNNYQDYTKYDSKYEKILNTKKHGNKEFNSISDSKPYENIPVVSFIDNQTQSYNISQIELIYIHHTHIVVKRICESCKSALFPRYIKALEILEERIELQSNSLLTFFNIIEKAQSGPVSLRHLLLSDEIENLTYTEESSLNSESSSNYSEIGFASMLQLKNQKTDKRGIFAGSFQDIKNINQSDIIINTENYSSVFSNSLENNSMNNENSRLNTINLKYMKGVQEISSSASSDLDASDASIESIKLRRRSVRHQIKHATERWESVCEEAGRDTGFTGSQLLLGWLLRCTVNKDKKIYLPRLSELTRILKGKPSLLLLAIVKYGVDIANYAYFPGWFQFTSLLSSCEVTNDTLTIKWPKPKIDIKLSLELEFLRKGHITPQICWNFVKVLRKELGLSDSFNFQNNYKDNKSNNSKILKNSINNKQINYQNDNFNISSFNDSKKYINISLLHTETVNAHILNKTKRSTELSNNNKNAKNIFADNFNKPNPYINHNKSLSQSSITKRNSNDDKNLYSDVSDSFLTDSKESDNIYFNTIDFPVNRNLLQSDFFILQNNYLELETILNKINSKNIKSKIKKCLDTSIQYNNSSDSTKQYLNLSTKLAKLCSDYLVSTVFKPWQWLPLSVPILEQTTLHGLARDILNQLQPQLIQHNRTRNVMESLYECGNLVSTKVEIPHSSQLKFPYYKKPLVKPKYSQLQKIAKLKKLRKPKIGKTCSDIIWDGTGCPVWAKLDILGLSDDGIVYVLAGSILFSDRITVEGNLVLEYNQNYRLYWNSRYTFTVNLSELEKNWILKINIFSNDSRITSAFCLTEAPNLSSVHLALRLFSLGVAVTVKEFTVPVV